MITSWAESRQNRLHTCRRIFSSASKDPRNAIKVRRAFESVKRMHHVLLRPHLAQPPAVRNLQRDVFWKSFFRLDVYCDLNEPIFKVDRFARLETEQSIHS